MEDSRVGLDDDPRRRRPQRSFEDGGAGRGAIASRPRSERVSDKELFGVLLGVVAVAMGLTTFVLVL